MMFDLFSSADFKYSNFHILKFLIWPLGFLWVLWNLNVYYFSLFRLSSLFSMLSSWHWEKVKSEVLQSMKGSYVLMGGSFLLILGSNIWGLFPYIFGVTTQMVLTFTAAWMVWLTMVFSSAEFSLIKFFSKFSPMGAPGYLAPMLALIELVSCIIRPLTLSLRLSMNMTTGHVFIALMSVSSKVVLFLMKMLLALLMVLMWGYFLFEVGMGFIQAFVFSLLSVQYLGEHV